MFPIYIPSKGRADLVKGAITMLNDSRILFTLVVDPQELGLYRPRAEKIIITDKNGAGLCYAREFIRRYSISRGETWHWQINDDICRFSLREPGMKMVEIPPINIIHEIENKVSKYSNIGLAGTEENVWPPHESGLRVNYVPAEAILINNQVAASFRQYPGFEDLDFLLQVLQAGFCSLKFDHLRVVSPTPGTNKGGSFQVDRNTWREKFMSAWPGVEFNPGGSPGGKPNHRWIMKNYTQRPALKIAKRFKLE